MRGPADDFDESGPVGELKRHRRSKARVERRARCAGRHALEARSRARHRLGCDAQRAGLERQAPPPISPPPCALDSASPGAVRPRRARGASSNVIKPVFGERGQTELVVLRHGDQATVAAPGPVGRVESAEEDDLAFPGALQERVRAGGRGESGPEQACEDGATPHQDANRKMPSRGRALLTWS